MNTNQKNNMNVPAKDLPVEEKSNDFRDSFHWRVLRILSEFTNGFQFLADFNDIKTVSVFGSAEIKEDDLWYKKAREFGELLAKNGYGVVTGGGPGIMEAANRGAFEAGGESIGLNIQLPFEQRVNPWVKKAIGFHYFFSRKVMLSYAAQAYVYFPGGFGTLDELLELATLLQTKKISQKIPIILVGKDFWSPLQKWMKEYWVDKYHTASDEDINIPKIVDTPEEALEVVKTAPHIKYF